MTAPLQIRVNDFLLSIFCGVALFASARAINAYLVGYVPDEWLFTRQWGWLSPLDRLAFARVVLFVPVLAVLAPLFAWPMARHASRRDIALTLPGAACGGVLLFMLSQLFAYHPFPLWMDVLRAMLLFISFPIATAFWWKTG